MAPLLGRSSAEKTKGRCRTVDEELEDSPERGVSGLWNALKATIHQLLPSFVSGAITSKFGYSLTFLTEQGIRSLYLANTYYILSLWAQNTYETIFNHKNCIP